jgi:hypothetical protein
MPLVEPVTNAVLPFNNMMSFDSKWEVADHFAPQADSGFHKSGGVVSSGLMARLRCLLASKWGSLAQAEWRAANSERSEPLMKHSTRREGPCWFDRAGSAATGGLLACVALLSACGGGGGPPAAPSVKLTASATALPLGGSLNLNWQAANAATCQATGAWAGAQTVNGQFVWTPAAAGSYTFTLTCTGEGGVGAAQAVVEVLAPPTVAVNVNPGQVRLGERATVAWASGGTTSCVASGAWSGSQTSSGNVFVTEASVGSYSYSLQCTGPGGTVSSQATLQVLPALPVVSIAATPGSVVVGQNSTLTWSATNATGCSASGAWAGALAINGTANALATNAGSSQYVVTCTGPGGTASATATVQVAAPPAPVVSLSATPASLSLGRSTTLVWSSANATSCLASGDWSGPRNPTGIYDVTPTSLGTATFGLSCTGPGGTSTSTTAVEVAPSAPTVAITATPTSVELGQSTALSWASTSATSCSATGAWSGQQATSGGAAVTPAATGSIAYGLQCTGPGGTGSGSVFITVTNPPPPVVTLSLSPSTVARGQFFTISWSSTNATRCVGADALAGYSGSATSNSLPSTSQTLGSSVYSLVCTGPGGSTTQSATLTVAP